ncbi:hypothetical protein O181_054627 [Austropuccinia psidii MF-1]|uniref:Uncharacterized protein n=1 Tax=Austropuccinia psidii MF-1 TaxID=1389203 RepID=A0A9Q3E7A2_9BASI|nr:hypothetical protein [Austropuccinia psidii MF-1]
MSSRNYNQPKEENFCIEWFSLHFIRRSTLLEPFTNVIKKSSYFITWNIRLTFLKPQKDENPGTERKYKLAIRKNSTSSASESFYSATERTHEWQERKIQRFSLSSKYKATYKTSSTFHTIKQAVPNPLERSPSQSLSQLRSSSRIISQGATEGFLKESAAKGKEKENNPRSASSFSQEISHHLPSKSPKASGTKHKSKLMRSFPGSSSSISLSNQQHSQSLTLSESPENLIITKEELELLHQGIQNIIIPSWIAHIPKEWEFFHLEPQRKLLIA